MSRHRLDYKKLLLNPIYYLRLAITAFIDMKDPLRAIYSYAFLTKPKHTYKFTNNLEISTCFQEDAQVIFAIFFHRTYGDIGSEKVIVDIGAHIGVFTLYAAYDKNNTVYCFEPSPINFRMLQANIKNNSPLGTITIAEKAVTSKPGQALMAANLGNLSRLYRQDEEPTFGEVANCVECTTLEDIFNEHSIEKCDILKIDCEGSEYDILFNAPEYLFERIREIRMECDYLNANRNKVTMQNFLKLHGYRITHDRRSVFFATREGM